MKINAMKKYITAHAKNNSVVVVDESMIFWFGEDWRSQSLVTQSKWISEMYDTRKVSIFIIHSWTKIWKCCGIRIGSIVAPNREMATAIRVKQTPWSVNMLGLAFMSAACKDAKYMRKTWKVTPVWRQSMCDAIADIFPAWQMSGPPFISWIWCDTHSAQLAEICTEECKAAGVPIRWAKCGYNQPTCVRFGVRQPKSQRVLFDALRSAKEIFEARSVPAVSATNTTNTAITTMLTVIQSAIATAAPLIATLKMEMEMEQDPGDAVIVEGEEEEGTEEETAGTAGETH